MNQPKLQLEPAVLTIFGITGDLARRKLLPALYQLADSTLLPIGFQIVGTTRQALTTDDVIETIKAAAVASGQTTKPKTLTALAAALTVIQMDITQPDDYRNLKSQLDALEDSLGQCLHRLYYLAIPSSVFEPVIKRLGQHDLNAGCQHGITESRLLIEKPFGYDLTSASELIAALKGSFKEKQIYRIDHYLAKETVQNIMTLRFANPLFKSVWNGQHVSQIMITAAESIGIEGRANFYEQTGALRDVIQSHLLQVLALITMEQPASDTEAAIHTARQQLLDQIKPPAADQMAKLTVRGQYDGYNKEVSKADSSTETYAAVQLSIDNDSWRNTAVFIRTGKHLAAKTTEVTLAFNDASGADHVNYLTIRIEPNEGIVMDLQIKKPGYDARLEHVQMDFCYDNTIDAAHPDAYERVLVDALRGDKTLFASNEAILASWLIMQPILDAWQLDRVPLNTYEPGSWGPTEADKLIEAAGGRWMTDQLKICSHH